MALISCPECGRQVSSEAIACPNCGYQINPASWGAENEADAEFSEWLQSTSAAQEPPNSFKVPSVLRKQSTRPPYRPLPGIVVAIVFASLGLILDCLELFANLRWGISYLDSQLFQLFPSLGVYFILNTSFSMLSNPALLIGAILSFLWHPAGNKVVRVTSSLMLVWVLIASFLAVRTVLNSPSWAVLDDAPKYGMIGGLIGGAVGGAFGWGLILFLFRKRK